jgi:hypothetical protein
MFGNLLKSVSGAVSSVAEVAGSLGQIALAPVEVVATVANAAVKPVAEGAQAVVQEVKDLTK